MHFTSKECDVVPYTDAYETIKAVPIVQAATVYNNPEKGETMILILNEAIWMGETMDHNLMNPNRLRAYVMTVQDNSFSEAPIFIATEDHEFMLTLSSKGTILGVATRTPTASKLLGKQIFFGSNSCANEQVTCGYVCSYLFVGVLVATPSIVPLEDKVSMVLCCYENWGF